MYIIINTCVETHLSHSTHPMHTHRNSSSLCQLVRGTEKGINPIMHVFDGRRKLENWVEHQANVGRVITLTKL